MFNWFRRQHGDSPKDKQQEQEPKKSATEPVKSEPESTTTETAVDENYLQWAKAAFQNIQQRQAQKEEDGAVEEDATVTEEIEGETTQPESPTLETESEVNTEVLEEKTDSEETIAELTEEATLEEAIKPEITESETDTQEVTPEVSSPTNQESISPPSTVTETPEAVVTTETEPEATSAANVPAWMRKSDGLERLRETAIEIEEPEAETGVAFDEDFVWSAKVLASQGRSPEDVSAEEITWLKKLRQGLGKTRRSLVNQLKAVVGQGPLNEDAVMEIESLLLQADVGVEATDYVIETLQNKLLEEALPPEQAIAYLKSILQDILDQPLAGFDNTSFEPQPDILNIWLMTGVNGAGKTTTIGKLAHMSQQSGYDCLIAAADTFRAAAVEQVKVWGERANTPVIANPGKNTDPAAVVFDAISAAQSRQAQLLLVDTAGRLQNKKNLMDELAKIRRIVDKKAPNAKVESLLVLDATLGQNGLRQAQVFSEAAKLSGVVLTKLDGSAKGGVALAVAQQLNLPIRFIGAGEGIEDLRPFSSYEFVEALLSE